MRTISLRSAQDLNLTSYSIAVMEKVSLETYKSAMEVIQGCLHSPTRSTEVVKKCLVGLMYSMGLLNATTATKSDQVEVSCVEVSERKRTMK